MSEMGTHRETPRWEASSCFTLFMTPPEAFKQLQARSYVGNSHSTEVKIGASGYQQ